MIKRIARPQKLDWIILLAISTLLFISHIYNDILITTRHGINLWNTLFNGHILSFYSYNLEAVSGNIVYTTPQSGAYDFLTYVVFAIWDFPLWILERFFKVDVMNSILCLLWSKALLIFFLLLSAKVVIKICLEMKMNKDMTKWCVFSYLSSAFVFSSLFIMSQYDVISLSIMLIGLLMYIKENTRKFVFWFALAISLKIFALFLFIPLILLKEKRILLILKYFIGGMSLTILFKLIFIFDFVSKSSSTFQIGMIRYLTKNSLQLSIGNISIFFTLTVLLYIFCYFKNIRSIEELHKFSIYISFLSFAIFFCFAYTYPYWVILFVPFIILLIFQNYNKLKINILIEIAMTSSFIIAQMIVFYWCYGIKTLIPMVLPKIFGKASSFQKEFSLDVLSLTKGTAMKNSVLPILLAVFVACVIALAVINYPKNNDSKIDEEVIMDRSVIWSRLVIGSGICLIPIAGYIASVLS